VILDTSLTDATEVVLSCLCVHLELWQCPIPTLFMFLAAFRFRLGRVLHKKPYEEALWSPSYFAVSVGDKPIDVLKQYIKN
jgi:REP element-mobilizing transposase RayT